MRATGLIWTCEHCNEEFEVFSDDGAGDMTACWNWCPHCYKSNNIWVRFKHPNEKIRLGLAGDHAKEKEYVYTTINIITYNCTCPKL